MVKNNNGCFIGYKFPFSFWISNNWSAKPLNDKIASLYIKPSNEIMLRLIKGKTTKEANEESKRMMIQNMKKILALKKKKEPGATGMLQLLWGNFKGQVILGNKEARITQ